MICNEAIQNSYHLFFHCLTAANVWRASGVWSRLEPLVQQYQSAEDVIFIMLQHGNSSQVESFATILWRCGRAEISEFGSKLAAFWSARNTYWRIGVMRRLQNAHAAGTGNNSSSNNATADQQNSRAKMAVTSNGEAKM